MQEDEDDPEKLDHTMVEGPDGKARLIKIRRKKRRGGKKKKIEADLMS